jgi:hypothetical protein
MGFPEPIVIKEFYSKEGARAEQLIIQLSSFALVLEKHFPPTPCLFIE